MTTPVYVDVESTGLDPRRHEIFEVALIDGDDRYLWWLDPDLSTADPNALRMNRFYERDFERASPSVEPDPYQIDRGPAEAAKHIARLTSGRQLCAFNPTFDAGFLKALLWRHDMVPAWDYHLVALESMCAGFLLATANETAKDSSLNANAEMLRLAATDWNSTSMSTLVGVDRSEFDKHTAMGDALWHQAVHVALTWPAEHGER